MRSNGSRNSAQNSASIQKTRGPDLFVLVGPEVQPLDRPADRRHGPAGSGPARDEVRRQADRAGPRTPCSRTARKPGRSPRAGSRDPAHRPRCSAAAARRSRGSCSLSTRSSVRRQGTYARVSHPSSGSSKSLVRKTASSRVVFQTSRSQASAVALVDRPVVQLADRLASDPVVSEADGTSGRSRAARSTGRCCRSARDSRPGSAARVRGSRSGATRAAGIPVAWASSV